MREREGDCGKKNRINNFKYLKKSQMKLSLVYTNVIRFG